MWRKIKELFFRNRTTRQTVAKNAFWLTVSNVGGRLLRAVIIIYAARILGASEWGIFSYAISLVAFLTIFTDAGISPILVRETAKLREKTEEQSFLLSSSFILKSAFLTLGILIILLVVPHFNIEDSVKAILPLAVAILIFDNFREFGFSLIRAREKMELEAGLFLLTNMAVVVFGFLFLYYSKTVSAFTYAYALGTGVGMVVTSFVLRRYLSGILSKFRWSTVKYIMSSGWPFAISAVLAVLLVDTDVLLLGWLRSTEEVGLYSAAIRIVQILYLLPSILSTSLLPAFARLAGKDNEKLRLGLEQVLGLVYLIAIPMAIGGIVLAKEIIDLVFGSGYAAAVLPFRILILTILISFPAVILSSVIFTYDKQRQIIKYAAIGGLSNVILDLIFIPKFGMAGSAVVTLVAQLLANIYLWRVAKTLVPFQVLPHLQKAIGASAILAIFVLVLKVASMPVLVTIGVSIPVYFSTLHFLREPILNEVKLILRLVKDTQPTSS
ncbi:MAG: flippase [Patescibacteria group bacterium]